MEDLRKWIVILLTTLDECDGWCPAGHFYTAMDMDMDAYERVTSAASRAGWIIKTTETLTLTDKGRAQARQIEAAFNEIAKAREARIAKAKARESRDG